MIWEAYGHVQPAKVLTLDGVPRLRIPASASPMKLEDRLSTICIDQNSSRESGWHHGLGRAPDRPGRRAPGSGRRASSASNTSGIRSIHRAPPRATDRGAPSTEERVAAEVKAPRSSAAAAAARRDRPGNHEARCRRRQGRPRCAPPSGAYLATEA